MKAIIFFFMFCVLWLDVIAQAPQKMSYQAVIRDNAGNLVTNQTIGMRITILEGTLPGTSVYEETQTPTTNNNGLVTLEIGGGVGFDTIHWENGLHFIKTETDPTGSTNYTITGTRLLLSVPYALHAGSSDLVTDATLSGSGIAGNPLKIADNGVTSAKIQDGTITSSDLANMAVTSAKIQDGTILTGDLAADAVNSFKILDGTVSNADLANNAVTTAKITIGSVTGDKIAQGGATTGQVLKWNSTTWAPANDETGGGGLTLPYQGTGALNDAPLFRIVNTTESGVGIFGQSLIGVMGESNVISGTGVSGHCSNGFGVNGEGNIGVSGVSYSTTGKGVRGMSIATSGTNYGIYGSSGSPDGYGVYGIAPRFGVRGKATASPGVGVYGEGSTAFMGQTTESQGDGIRVNCSHSTGITHAVYGTVTSPNGYSGYFIGGRFYVGGNVGIGSENYNPEYRLEVRAPGTTSTGIAGFYNSNGESKVIIRQNSNGCGGVNIYNTGGTGMISLLGEGDSYINGGDVGIGTTAPNYKLDVRGTIGNNTTLYHSDRRWKNDILPLKYGIQDLMKLKGVSYLWNVSDFPDMGFDRNVQFGFIAQEFEKVIPELVISDKEGYKSIDYVKLTPVLVISIQEQQKIIEELQGDNDRLKAENITLKEKDNELHSRIERLEKLVGARAQK